jgi:hypothetical protein
LGIMGIPSAAIFRATISGSLSGTQSRSCTGLVGLIP